VLWTVGRDTCSRDQIFSQIFVPVSEIAKPEYFDGFSSAGIIYSLRAKTRALDTSDSQLISQLEEMKTEIRIMIYY